MKFRTIIYSIGALIVLSSCTPTNEKRGQEMAANYLKGVLFHYGSYEPIQTVVDSAFMSLANDKEAIDLMEEMTNLVGKAIKYSEDLNQSERLMEIWAPDGYDSAFRSGQYRRAKEEKERNQRLLDNAKKQIEKQFDKIKTRQSQIKKGDFGGWKVYHKFKSLNGYATVDLFGEYVFLCDEDFNVQFAYPKESYDVNSKMMETIEVSNSISEFMDNMQDLVI